ncbi:uncharacterized protein [Brachyistius frenatus]|uniref:uncharacterized protein n=1 Tax=Brachyistius frenatus TaxID=100188 RepID=UPI0037E920FF
MSHSGKVLHLYVEVRSAPDQNGGKGAFNESEDGIARGRSGQDNPAELLSQLASQTTCQTVSKAAPSSSSCSSAHHPVQDCTHGQSPSRNTLSFQLQQAGSSPTVAKRWSSPVHSSPSPSSGKVSVPPTPPACHRLNEGAVGDGTRSVVTFSYIEKSNVKTLDSPRSREERSTPSHFRKRLSDPVWFGSPDSSCGSSPKLTFRSPGSHQQTFSPGLRQQHLDPIGRAASQRAVEEFGSPLLRIKLAHALEHTSSSRYGQQARCQSWAGSPVQRQNISAHPKDHLADRSPAVCGLPRSPASDQLSCQSRQSPRSGPGSYVELQSPLHWPGEDRAATASPATKRHVHTSCSRSASPQAAILQLGNNGIEGLNQLSDSKSSSPARSPEVARRLAEEATKVSSILTEARRSSLHNALGEITSGSNSGESAPNAQQFKQTLKMNIPLNDQNTPAADNTDSHQPEHAHETNSRTNCEPRRDDRVQRTQHHGSPALPSRVIRPSHPPTEFCSPIRDPRLFLAELRAPDTPTLHRRQPPQYTGDSWSADRRGGDLSCFERGDCTELARRLFINQSVEEAPVSWTSRQQWGNHVENSRSPEPGSESDGNQTQSRQRRRPLSPTAQQKRAEQRRREILLLGPVALDSAEEDEGCDEEGRGLEVEGMQPGRVEEPPEAEQNGAMGGSSSRSSSGVTGSLGDRDCVSPESSQSSHQSNETGAATSGIQTDSGCGAPVPSLHCQRIARAKWEFLFGTPAEEAASRGEKNSLETSTAPPSGNSSESPTPTPPSSLPLLSANHEVQHVEVELVTPPPAVIGTSPKTGIIRRTLKYSETDLDAVPLRCYRETDIDEVMLAELDDADSAFGSNRSVQGTSGTGSSPLGELAYGRTDGERRGRREEEEEEGGGGGGGGR